MFLNASNSHHWELFSLAQSIQFLGWAAGGVCHGFGAAEGESIGRFDYGIGFRLIWNLVPTLLMTARCAMAVTE